MRWIVQTSLRYRYLIVFLAVVLMVFGIARLSNSSVDVFPEFAPPKVEIQTISLGLADGIDYLACAAYKHLLSPRGVAFLYVARDPAPHQMRSRRPGE